MVIGALLGWFLHGAISFVVRFFFVIVLLVPLVVVVVAYFRLRGRPRPAVQDRDDGTLVIWDAETIDPIPARRRPPREE